MIQSALLQKLFSDDFLSDEIKRRRREMFIVTDCTSFTVFPNEQNALHFAHSEGTREPAVYYKHSAATRLFRCAPTSGNPKGTFAAKPIQSDRCALAFVDQHFRDPTLSRLNNRLCLTTINLGLRVCSAIIKQLSFVLATDITFLEERMLMNEPLQ